MHSPHNQCNYLNKGVKSQQSQVWSTFGHGGNKAVCRCCWPMPALSFCTFIHLQHHRTRTKPHLQSGLLSPLSTNCNNTWTKEQETLDSCVLVSYRNRHPAHLKPPNQGPPERFHTIIDTQTLKKSNLHRKNTIGTTRREQNPQGFKRRARTSIQKNLNRQSSAAAACDSSTIAAWQDP
jgi:hypothetical protein